MDESDQVFVCVLFGPVGPVPKGHQCCNLCGSEPNDDYPCELCGDTGYWSADSFRAYHERHPEICREVCGEQHLDPYLGPPRDIEELEKESKTILARADELLKKHS